VLATHVPGHPTSPPALSIVVPTYNERERLSDLVAEVFRAYAAEDLEAELIIVDDNSPDGTGALADQLATRHRIQVLHRAGKLGLGTAVIAGFAKATAPIVGVIDADLSHPPHVLPRMTAVMQQTGADVVVASRYVPGGGVKNWPLHRHLMSRAACLAARGLTPVRDAASGFFLIRRELAAGVTISAGGFKICLELLVRSQPARVIEVPYLFEDRAAGESKMSVREALGFVVQLMDLYRFRRAASRRTAIEYRRLTPDELQRERLIR
jgi:dolichol-phosphate mannosyltransferase